MRIFNADQLEQQIIPELKKQIDGQDVSLQGAFPEGKMLEMSMTVQRELGIRSVVLRIRKDGDTSVDVAFCFEKSLLGKDEYRLSLPLTKELCHGDSGLFYYEFLFIRGVDTLFSDTSDNVHFCLSQSSQKMFRLTVYQNNFSVPDWFSGGVMYHIFVDRFCKGTGNVGNREDCVINPDWDSGIPQFAQKQGEALANNEFFGGNLWGVAEKLPYLASLGVTILYLSPIFKAYSNHKYDTGDYEVIDEMFGGQEAFENLISKAEKAGIKVLLDGVFNHTGDDSRYFNKYGKYDSLGAFQSPDSPFRNWFCFDSEGKKYDSWWGISILPKLNPQNPACRNYLAGDNGIAHKYVSMGTFGWRLDVADELSDDFLDLLRTTVKKTNPQAVLIGEVWENAADKIAYGQRRRYFQGKQLDSVMNYPLREAILSFVLRGDGNNFGRLLTDLYSSYPKCVCDALMNLIGTHDTERILTVLGNANTQSMSNSQLSVFQLEPLARKKAIAALKVASILQFTVFGVPSIFYGDEAGMEGGRDPFCRRPYPWGREEADLVSHYQALGKMRTTHSVFKHGSFRMLESREGFVCFERVNSQTAERILVLANSSVEEIGYSLDGDYVNVLNRDIMRCEIRLSPMEALILQKKEKANVQKID